MLLTLILSLIVNESNMYIVASGWKNTHVFSIMF